MYKRQLYLIVIYVPVLNVIALLLAVAVYNSGRAGTVYKTLLFFSNLLSMTVVALIFVPIVIAYQIWVYRVFRKKIDPTGSAEENY